MLKILDRYILRGFLPILLMTFLISWFIVLMQFLWKYVDELVGKGLSMLVVAEVVFYAAMSLIPLALSLGVLFASLMFFGNLGERLELLAMKASGVSLYRIMRPVFVTVVLLAIGLFVFQNTYMITSQVRMWTIILSARQASPELEIPEGTFYNGIPGYSIYVSQRDPIHTGRMHDIMIYDHQAGNNGVRIVRADSGRIVMDAGQTFLTWRLYDGQSFENLSTPAYTLDERPTTYAKERFGYKEILIQFDANFHEVDENEMRGRFVGKNLTELNYAIDTATHLIDSIRGETARTILYAHERERYSYQMPSLLDTTQWANDQRRALLGTTTAVAPLSVDSLMRGMSLVDSLSIVGRARQKLETQRAETEIRREVDKSAYYEFRTNRQEWHRKFTFPAACIVFFFIGAPMGAIIRKGGLGMPVVFSVLFFIIYYIIDTFGHNMILSQKMSVELGMWISTIVLLPVGFLLTYQATRDSATLNVEAYVLFFRKLLHLDRVRKLEFRQIVFETVDYAGAGERVEALRRDIKRAEESGAFGGSLLSWVRLQEAVALPRLSKKLDAIVSELNNSQNTLLVAKLMDMPMLSVRLSSLIPARAPWGRIAVILSYIFLPVAWYLHRRRRSLGTDLSTTYRLLGDVLELIERERAALQS